MTLTVPLISHGDGTWGSPNPAWDRLIRRESSGNPTIIQQIIDVNSGGNEAEGLFQITPATWRAHNGTEFAPTARLATPQQQAIVAARIFTANPSGSDWGAGLPGREDADELAAGLVPLDAGPPAPTYFLDFARESFLRHLGEAYVYGGTGEGGDNPGFDCSLLVDFELTALTTGSVAGFHRTVTTESWPPDAPVGAQGPYRTIKAASLQAIPADAVAIIPIKHHGGGANSHMEIQIGGTLMEAGDPICTQPDATPIDDPIWTDYWYLPGGGTAPPQEDELTPEQDRMIREIHACLFNQIESQSSYRALGEGARWQLHELIKNDDSMLHQQYVESQAREGDPESLALLAAISAADPVQFPDRQEDAARARRFLASLAAAPGPGPAPAPTPTPSPSPSPNPVPAPAPTPPPAGASLADILNVIAQAELQADQLRRQLKAQLGGL